MTFDLSDKKSFDELSKWKKNFIDSASPQDPAKFPFVVVGNKSDKPRVVSEQDAKQWCQQNGGYSYFETSALNGLGVDPVFKRSAELTATGDSMEYGMPTSLSGAGGAMKLDAADNQARTLQQQEEKKKKKCC